MSSLYNCPLREGDEERIHSPAGVRALVKDSSLMQLLLKLDKDGYDVSGAAAELTALINYVSSTNVSMSDLLSHLDYCTSIIKKNLPDKT